MGLSDRSKFPLLEALFKNYKPVRRFLGGYWVKLNEPGYTWIRVKREVFKRLKHPDDMNFEIEDYVNAKGDQQ